MSVVRVYLPIEAENYHQAYDFITDELSKSVGGWTNWRATGGWVDGSGKKCVEPVMVIEGVGEWVDPEFYADTLAVIVKDMTNEDALLAVADGEKVLVE